MLRNPLFPVLPARHGASARAVVVLLAVVVLAGCAGTGPVPLDDQRADTRVLSPAVFDIGYDRIHEVYLRPVDMAELTVDGLSGLSAIDDGVTAVRAGSTVRLLSDEVELASFSAPPGDDPQAWAALTMAAIEQGRTVSPALRNASAEDIYRAVFDAIVADLDEYSRYVDAEHATQERAGRDGYGGIGILLEFDEEGGRGYVQQVFPDGPAAAAGVRVGEAFVEVNGRSTEGWDLPDLANRLRGPVDTVVTVTLEGAEGNRRTLRIRRQQVIYNTVETRIDNGVGIIRVARFNAATTEHLSVALNEVLAELGADAVGLILDLRGNPGGLLGQSVSVADMFLPRGAITSTRGRHPDSIQHYTAGRDDRAASLPMVVLVDGRSASGAEVVAAALQDSGRAVVVGASSYGKGSVQTVTRLPNGGELFLTWSRIYSPAGITIHRQGVMPTICTSNGLDDPEHILTRFRAGELDLPPRLQSLRRTAADDDGALAALRNACPWRAHDEELDVVVAERLLEQPDLFARALRVSGPEALAQR